MVVYSVVHRTRHEHASAGRERHGNRPSGKEPIARQQRPFPPERIAQGAPRSGANSCAKDRGAHN